MTPADKVCNNFAKQLILEANIGHCCPLRRPKDLWPCVFSPDLGVQKIGEKRTDATMQIADSPKIPQTTN